jgi:hypothetical protein
MLEEVLLTRFHLKKGSIVLFILSGFSHTHGWFKKFSFSGEHSQSAKKWRLPITTKSAFYGCINFSFVISQLRRPVWWSSHLPLIIKNCEFKSR